jgi:electron transport complex protein RnfG
MNKDYIMPVIVLPLMCLFVSGALAFCNSITFTVIEIAAAERAEAARRIIIPQADGFELLDVEALRSQADLPKSVTQVFRTTNNKGFIFMVTTSGYGGEIKLICGIDPDGKVIRSEALAQKETKGLGTPVFEEPHAGQYWGKDKNGIEGVAAISGATITSTAYKNGIRDAFAAYEIVKGAR